MFGGYDRAGKKLQSIEALKVEPHIWTQLQNSLFRWSLNTLLHTVVLNDRLFVFDTSYEINSKFAVWNDDMQTSVRLEVKGTVETSKKVLKGVQIHVNNVWRNRRVRRIFYETPYLKFCTIQETAVISALFKENKRLSFVRSHFSEKNTLERDWFFK